MGAKLIEKDHGWAALLERVKQAKEARVVVGVLSDGPGGAKAEGGDLSLAELAVLLEHGNIDNGGHIPPRPAFQLTFDAMRSELVAMGRKLMAAFLAGKMPMAQALGLMGAAYAAAVKKTITEGAGVPPPNAPATIKAKGSSRPWVDTGRLINAISWAVQHGKKGNET